jgi:hypothetical protein
MERTHWLKYNADIHEFKSSSLYIGIFNKAYRLYDLPVNNNIILLLCTYFRFAAHQRYAAGDKGCELGAF